MLAFLSDLHLTDGTTANNVNPEALGILADRIESSARRRGAVELKLVLLGDILDLVRTDWWHRNVPRSFNRPWGGVIDPETGMNDDRALVERQFRAVLGDILAEDAKHQRKRAPGLGRLLERLDAFCRSRGIPFQTIYVIGNHDRVLHNFPSLRRTVRNAYPQITSMTTQYRNRRYAVVARHGHEWDVNTHGFEFKRAVLGGAPRLRRFDAEAYRVMAIGEVVTAELMGGLIHHAKAAGASPRFLDQLKDVNNLRPMEGVFEWIDWIGQGSSPRNREIMHGALRASLDGVVKCAFAKRWDALERDLFVRGDLVDRLQLARSVLGGSFEVFRRRAGVLRSLAFLIGDSDEVFDGAGEEFASLESREPTLPDWTQYLIYGHTHRPRRDYLSADRSGRVQMYVNTGTYLPLINRTGDGRSFATEKRMTLTFLYRSDEDTSRKRGGPSIDIWSGVRRKNYRA